jgi:hypothetical protein
MVWRKKRVVKVYYGMSLREGVEKSGKRVLNLFSYVTSCRVEFELN